MAARGRWLRGGRLIEGYKFHSFLQLFRGFDYWPLTRGWPLNEGLTVVVWHIMSGLRCHACISGMLNEGVLS